MMRQSIIGMWGVLDNKLVHPSTPNSEPVVLFYDWTSIYSNKIYFISDGKTSVYHGDCVESVRSDPDPVYKNDINDYLNSEELIINRIMLSLLRIK